MADFKTLTDLTTEAFGILTGLDPSQQPATEDLDTIGTYVRPLLATLARKGVVLIQDEDEIPEEYFLPIARLLANACGPRYGVAMNAAAKLEDETELYRLTNVEATDEVVRVDYF